MTESNEADHSRFVQRVRRRYAHFLHLLPPGTPQLADWPQVQHALSAQGFDVPSSLRILRNLVVERLAVLDTQAGAPLGLVTQTMTHLAEYALQQALALAHEQLQALHGAPMGADGQPAQLCIMGMGKLGGRELNVSSDIDLVYVYNHDGHTTGLAHGAGRLSNQEYFAKVAKHMQHTIGEVTEHGFVFRVDLALRPNGNSGPVAVSLSALETYLQVQGREWERFAWLKSRLVAPNLGTTTIDVQNLRTTVLPFVFRRYLDYRVFEALRQLHRQIRQHATHRAAGHPERQYDVKLSRGGIREIEFTVQLLQVVRGGQFPELRTRSTLTALERLARAGLMTQDVAQRLADAYVFLRRVEHRIQYLDDQQTHILPTADADLDWMARTLGLVNACELLRQLDTHREAVAQEFDTLLGNAANERDCKHCPTPTTSQPADWQALAQQLPSDLKRHVSDLFQSPRAQALPDESRARLYKLVQRSMQWLEAQEASETALIRLFDWMESLLRRDSYLALLQERPSVHKRLIKLLGAARWPARYLRQHPGVIDELASPAVLHERFDAPAFEQELNTRWAALRKTQEDDEERLLNLLRQAHHAEVFRTLMRDIEGVLSVQQVADDLSALADAILRITTQWCWARMKHRHRADAPQFGIIAYGKLGGKELGYGSDLDIVFVYDDDHDDAPAVYATLVRKMINWLTVKTSEGDLFEIDTALRPNGSSGLLVTQFAAYAQYQQGRGSNTAWTWEHQAMTRARWVAGPEHLAQQFEGIRLSVVTAPRQAAQLASEILAMRAKVSTTHTTPAGMFDFKHSAGGMMDAEFMVQYLVLLHAYQHPALQRNSGNIELLRQAEQAGLIPPPMGQAAAQAYEHLRQLQHRARLDEAPPYTNISHMQNDISPILALWQALFGASHWPMGAPAQRPDTG